MCRAHSTRGDRVHRPPDPFDRRGRAERRHAPTAGAPAGAADLAPWRGGQQQSCRVGSCRRTNPALRDDLIRGPRASRLGPPAHDDDLVAAGGDRPVAGRRHLDGSGHQGHRRYMVRLLPQRDSCQHVRTYRQGLRTPFHSTIHAAGPRRSRFSTADRGTRRSLAWNPDPARTRPRPSSPDSACSAGRGTSSGSSDSPPYFQTAPFLCKLLGNAIRDH